MTTGILIEGLRKRYGQGDTAVDALKHVDMQVAPGEVVGLIGPSGSGKSTLLKCLGAIIDPSAGRMTLGDEVIYDDGWKVRDLRALRRDKIGFVFQAPYLIPFLDVTDNVALLPTVPMPIRPTWIAFMFSWFSKSNMPLAPVHQARAASFFAAICTTDADLAWRARYCSRNFANRPMASRRSSSCGRNTMRKCWLSG